jgi:hypothetical protein
MQIADWRLQIDGLPIADWRLDIADWGLGCRFVKSSNRQSSNRQSTIQSAIANVESSIDNRQFV